MFISSSLPHGFREPCDGFPISSLKNIGMGLLTSQARAWGGSGYGGSVGTSSWCGFPNEARVLSPWLGWVTQRGRPAWLVSSLCTATVPIVGRWSSGRVPVGSLIGRVGIFLWHFLVRGRSRSCLIFRLA